MGADDSEGKPADSKHFLGGVEHSKQDMRNKFKTGKPEQHQAKCDFHTDLDCLDHTLPLLCTVTVSDDWRNSVVQSENRHKEETLKFEIYSKNCRSRGREINENLIHAVGHNGTNGLHYNRRNTYHIDIPDQDSV